RHFGRRVADHRRQQHATQRVAQGVTITTLERLHHDFRVTRSDCFDIDDTWFQQTVLHEMSSSIPSARYTDKADGINRKRLLDEQAVIRIRMNDGSGGNLSSLRGQALLAALAHHHVVPATGGSDFPRRREPNFSQLSHQNWIPAFAGTTSSRED